MLGLRQKLSLGFGGLLLIILIIGIQSIIHLTKLGESIDVILRENYRSVIACQQMKEALERMDSGILFELLGYNRKGDELIRKNELVFEMALQVELNNITLPGEGEKASHLQVLFGKYKTVLKRIEDSKVAISVRRNAYFTDLFPLFLQIKDTAGEVLRMNQQNMSDANDLARNSAAAARKQMYILLVAGTIVAIGFVFFTGRWILRPINRLIQSADEIRRGNLDLVVERESRDEVGHLSEAFNAMAASLREFRRSDQAKLVRIQRATQQAFDSLPDAVAVVDLQGKVEVATEAAGNIFGLRPNTLIFDLPLGWMADLYKDALKDGSAVQQKVVQHFVGGEERYYRPEAIPILDNDRQLTGIILVLHDVTQLRQQEEIKRGVVSTVSHQLKTPLTSIRMAIHLLLEEKVGPLTEKQVELLVAANEDSDRLHGILNNLLDISRIESGRAQIDFHAVSPHSMVSEVVESFRRAAQDQGVSLSLEFPDDLPEVWADVTRINHVFGNLLSNALKYTPPGGKITLSAKADEERVQFSVSDTGRGIPSKYLLRIFEQFFRVPDQRKEVGAGLGLAIVKEIVEAHGGTIGVESHEGKGTTFTITLRRADRISKEESHA
jgi:signal transduction histidine kinase/HAMP domain-containing protein